MNSNEVVRLFFDELKQYNSTNFRTIERSKLIQDDESEDSGDVVIYKAFSSVVTRYFIFRDRHPEIDEASLRMLYYRLKIDMIARYFSRYPGANIQELAPFQRELIHHVRTTNKRRRRSPKPDSSNSPVITEASVTIGGDSK